MMDEDGKDGNGPDTVQLRDALHPMRASGGLGTGMDER
jgi:hypothetical protein